MIKIERGVKLDLRHSDNGEWREYLLALKKLKVGESFFYPRFASNHRMAISIVQTILGVDLYTRKEKDGYRVGRTA